MEFFNMYNNHEKFLYKLSKLNREKILWYKLSIIVLGALLFVIFEYDYIVSAKLEKYFLISGLIISSVWWYWTMGVISEILKIKNLQIEMLDEILTTIKSIKIDIKDP